MPTIKELKEICSCDTIARNKRGNTVFRRSFYYRHGMDAEKFRDYIKLSLINAGFDERSFEMFSHGEQYKSFRGGDTVAQGTHWWVEVKFT